MACPKLLHYFKWLHYFPLVEACIASLFKIIYVRQFFVDSHRNEEIPYVVKSPVTIFTPPPKSPQLSSLCSLCITFKWVYICKTSRSITSCMFHNRRCFDLIIYTWRRSVVKVKFIFEKIWLLRATFGAFWSLLELLWPLPDLLWSLSEFFGGSLSELWGQ